MSKNIDMDVLREIHKGQEGNLKIIQEKLRLACLNNGGTLLHVALIYSKLEIVKFILDSGVDVNYVDDKQGQSPIHFAATQKTHVLKFLLESGANVNAVTKYGRTPLFFSLAQQKMRNSKVLINNGADINVIDKYYKITLLMIAAEKGSPTIVKLLLRKGAEVNKLDSKNRTPLFYAIENYKSNVTKILIDSGADIDAVDKFGRTPLIYAVEKEKVEVAKLLLDAGANVDAKDKKNLTPFKIAISRKRDEIVESFLQNGCDINVLEEEHFKKNSFSESFLSYVLLMVKADFYVKKFIVEKVKLDYKNCFYKLKFYRKCTLEIEKMKTEKMYKTNLSIYQFLHNLNKTIYYVDCEDLLEHLKSAYYIENFPLYGRIIKNLCVRAYKRKLLEEKCNNILSSIPYFSRIPYYSIRLILSYLDIDDLQNISLIFKRKLS